VEKCGEYNTAHAHCMLGDLGYGNTLSTCDIYLFIPRHIYNYANETQLAVTRRLPVLLRNKGTLSSAYRGQHYDVCYVLDRASS